MLESAPQKIIRIPGIVALAIRPLPLLPLQFALRHLLAGILDRHPDLVGRLSGLERRRVAIDPDDLPFVIVLESRDGTISLSVVRCIDAGAADARIRAPLLVLMGLVDGAYDGDALFFSRDLAIEGDIEAVLALRNAIDDADIDILSEASATCGVLGVPFDRMRRNLASVLRGPVSHGEAQGRGAGP
jgi:predicted lipid carrier protein YhbT